MPAKVIDIGEWKKAHGIATPIEATPNETSTDVFLTRFLPPEIAKGLFTTTTIKRPTQ